MIDIRLTPYDEAPAVKDAHIEYARFAFVMTLYNGSYREGTLA